MDLYAEFQKAVRPFVTELERWEFQRAAESKGGNSDEDREVSALLFLSEHPCGSGAG